MLLWTLLLTVTTLALLCGFVIRPVAANMAALYRRAEAAEQSLWWKMAEGLVGLRTIVAARLFTLCGGLVGLHDFLLPYVGGVDWTPFTAQAPAWAVPVVIMATGALFEWLRRITTPAPASLDGSRDRSLA